MILSNKINCQIIILVVCFLISCGSSNRVEHIVGQYYLVQDEDKDGFSIGYKTYDGDFIGKIPAAVIEFGYNDTFVVAKTKKYKQAIEYYIVDRKKDSDIAVEENFRVGPLSEIEFKNDWDKRLNIRLNHVE